MFSLCNVPPSDAFLRELRPITRVGESVSTDCTGDHSIRIGVVPAFVSCGAILTIASDRREQLAPARYFTITWLHRTDGATIAEFCLRLLQGWTGKDEPVQLRVFTPRRMVELVGNIGEVLRRVVEVKGIEQEIECAHVISAFATIFADAVPLDGMEQQVGVVFSEEKWKVVVGEDLYDTLVRTSEIPLKKEHVSVMFSLTAQELGV